MDRETKIRASFADQARWCERLGSPFMARLCTVLGRELDREIPVGKRVLDWPGDPEPGADALALRLCGGLHALVRRGEAPDLARLYPPAPLPDEAALRAALEPVLAEQAEVLERWLDSAPQTNEVGRSAVLMSGLLVVADRFRQPVRLYELGASAGLNLLLDRYGYELGGLETGDLGSPLQLKPDWTGAPPPGAHVRIIGRAGEDLNPADAVADRDRLLAYVWPDQEKRLAQLKAALDIAAADPPRLDTADAAAWIEEHLPIEGEPGLTRVVMHSVAFQYFPPDAQDRVRSHLEQAGAAATAEAPLAWLRYEKLPDEEHYSLRLRTWPGEDRLLAWAHPHGRSIRWVAD